MTIDAPPSAPKLDAPKEQKQLQDGSTKACNEVYDLLKSMRPGSGNAQPSELKDFGNLQIEDSSAAAKLDKDLLKGPEIEEASSEIKLSSHPRHERPATHAKAGEAEQAEERRETEEKREGKEKSQQHHPGEQSKHPDQNTFSQVVKRFEDAGTEAQINIIKTATTDFLQEFQKTDKQFSGEADQSFLKGLQTCLNPIYESVTMIDETLHGKGAEVLPIFLQERTKQIDQLKKELDQVMKRGVFNSGVDTIVNIVKDIKQIFTEPGQDLAKNAAGMAAPQAFGMLESSIKSGVLSELPDEIKDPYEAVSHAKEQVMKPHEWDEKLGKLAHGERKEHHAGRSNARAHEASYTMSDEIASSSHVQKMLDDFEVIDDDGDDLKKRAV